MTYSDTILATVGLSAYWPLDGDATDAATGNDGTATNVTFDGTGIPGDPNSTTATFNGTNAYISVPDSADLDLGNVFTIEFWLARANDLTSQQGIVFKRQEGSNWSYLANLTNGEVRLDQPTAGIAIPGYGVSVASGWTHVAMTKAGTGANDGKLSINGVLRGTSTTARTLVDTNGALWIGAYGSSTPGAWYGGKLAHIALYKGTVLNDATIQAHYTAGITAPPPTVTGSFVVLGIPGTDPDAPVITLS